MRIVGVLLVVLLVVVVESLTFRRSMLSRTSNPSDTSFATASDTTTNVAEPKHQRRVRYKGSYPKKYSEKYKELQEDVAVVEKVKAKGSTPAGQHVPIMVSECLEYLALSKVDDIKQNIIALDCTLGYGGHTTAILQQIKGKNGTLYALDQDIEALEKTTARINENFNGSFNSFHINFKDVLEVGRQESILGKVDALLADLGYSSMQIDNPERGFSYKHEAALDMRMDNNKNPTTAQTWLATVTKKNFTEALKLNADFDDSTAVLLSQGIVSSKETINTTTALASKVREIISLQAKSNRLPVPVKAEIDSIVARVMQTIRIEVNDEFGSLKSLLASIPQILGSGGRTVVLTFHSGEDRLVKKSFKEGYKSGLYKQWGREVVLSSSDERRINPRSKCCKLRWAVKA